MFGLAFAIGIFSYLIFLLGMLGILYAPLIILVTIVFWAVYIFLQREEISTFVSHIPHHSYSLFFLFCLCLLAMQAVVNSVGLFGPEIGFDALWYHLTLPELYLRYHTIFHIPGGVFFYSDMPKLTEMLYTAGLAFSSETLTKGIHFVFGILCCIALYKVARRFFAPSIAILAPVIFYSNLVVGWESVSAYIDLSRTFFEIVTLWAFLIWAESKTQENFIKFCLLAGLTLTTKLLAGGTIVLYAVILLWYDYSHTHFFTRVKRSVVFLTIVFLVPLPWLVFSYIHTGNPFYPLFSHTLPLVNYWQVFTPLFFISAFWNTFAYASDPIHPIYLIAIPFVILYWKKLMRENMLILLLAIGGFAIWYFSPQSGGGRYILPYLPLFTLVVLYLITLLSERWKKAFIIIVLLCSVLSIGYRTIAVYKFIPVITGRETKAQFLAHHLDFKLGDFYDIDGYFAKHIKPTDTVLLYGFHNLYYANFSYIHESWVQKGDIVTYAAVQGKGLPDKIQYWRLVYTNATTGVRLYAPPIGVWRYY